MIYNLMKYIENQLPAISTVLNGLQYNSDDAVVVVSETGGIPSDYIDRNDFTVQMVSRANNKLLARDNAYSVYNLLHKKFGLVLPEETVDSVVYPSIRTWRIIGTNIPTSLGSDENGRNIFSLNFIITTE